MPAAAGRQQLFSSFLSALLLAYDQSSGPGARESCRPKAARTGKARPSLQEGCSPCAKSACRPSLLFGFRSVPRHGRGQRRRCKPTVEALEDRCVPATLLSYGQRPHGCQPLHDLQSAAAPRTPRFPTPSRSSHFRAWGRQHRQDTHHPGGSQLSAGQPAPAGHPERARCFHISFDEFHLDNLNLSTVNVGLGENYTEITNSLVVNVTAGGFGGVSASNCQITEPCCSRRGPTT